tara:strand:+ start:1936 stop:2868 length:933 start_codon:yes stop_codon:yes gene_type:complete
MYNSDSTAYSDDKYDNEPYLMYKEELENQGYTIIPNVYNKEEIAKYKDLFFDWYNSTSDLKYLHNIIHKHGIFKHFDVGHQRFAWLTRINPKIQDIFKYIWSTDEIVTGFDGCCYYPSDFSGNYSYWTHTDQSSRKKGPVCYQSFLSLTNNYERTLLVYSYSHLLHEHYFKSMGIDCPTNWNIIDRNYCDGLLPYAKTLYVQEGSLVIWDSRLFHQNVCGNSDCREERLIQYLCFLPKYNELNTEKENKKRKKFFNNLNTTSHWPYPLNAVPKQPTMYNYYNPENQIVLDYDKLKQPNISDLLPEIEKII